MNEKFQLQVQVYDAKTSLWSFPSLLSDFFNTKYATPLLSLPIKLINGSINLSWTIVEATIMNPIRFKIKLFFKSTNETKEWPGKVIFCL